jgi:hypothetical protein
MTETNTAIKKPKQHWLMWWRVDADELKSQIETYKTAKIWKSARGLSALCLLFSSVVTIAFIYFKITPVGGGLDAAIMIVLAGFIYFGHRWAMIAAMLLWTVEKALAIYEGASHGASGGILTSVIWWCIYMSAFWLALRVETERRKAPTLRPVQMSLD